MDKLVYQVNDSLIALTEQKNEGDVEFLIKAKTDEALNRLRAVRQFFDSDKIYTDILFYSRKNGEFQVIVRKNVYAPFIAHLFQLQLIRSVSWKNIS
ncbi:hypothetical protein [Sporolactobacillus putidus]|uniref:Uncharacterized protein n=1 Tax=Sporolactobacillus putidus TaxID=492735 RepID=A0A917W3B7_9BACL|nr:hypothetical protein [Sporolactobacillus putidus]GGL62997.1 hypothetical protein GCM10007968_28630 [Sporolactobacillus putidus]